MKKNRIPFIAKYSEKRDNGTRSLKLHYDEKTCVTMARIKDKHIPLVKLNNPIPELLTKTESRKEADDYNPTTLELELQTKTNASKESDEGGAHYLQLVTKTFAEKESDDVSFDIAASELYTKTKQEVESEDRDINNEITLS